LSDIRVPKYLMRTYDFSRSGMLTIAPSLRQKAGSMLASGHAMYSRRDLPPEN
jgi:hypothetical protein